MYNFRVSHQSRVSVWPYEQFEKQVASHLTPAERHDPAKAPIPPYYPDTSEVRRTLARYYDCVTVMDKETGDLLRQLEQDGLAEDTIVFFWPDQGRGLPRGKRVLQDTGLQVPLVPNGVLPAASPWRKWSRVGSSSSRPPRSMTYCGCDGPARQ